jgi:hypothetical protein
MQFSSRKPPLKNFGELRIRVKTVIEDFSEQTRNSRLHFNHHQMVIFFGTLQRCPQSADGTAPRVSLAAKDIRGIYSPFQGHIFREITARPRQRSYSCNLDRDCDYFESSLLGDRLSVQYPDAIRGMTKQVVTIRI